MKTTEYLSQIERINRQIENKTEEIVQLQHMITNVTSRIEQDRVQTTQEPDKIGSAVAKIVDAEKEINELVSRLIEKRAMIVSQIDAMEDTRYYNILSKKYVALKTFGEIAKEYPLDRRYVFRLHNKALGAFEKKYGHLYLDLDKRSH